LKKRRGVSEGRRNKSRETGCQEERHSFATLQSDAFNEIRHAGNVLRFSILFYSHPHPMYLSATATQHSSSFFYPILE
jgi:hypothetical protein